MSRTRIEARDEGDVTIVTFVDARILHDPQIQKIGEELVALVDESKRKNILIDFGSVEYFSSAALGKLITLSKKVRDAGGKLILCEVSDEGLDGGVDAVFRITKIWKIFAHYFTKDRAQSGKTLAEALTMFTS